MLNSPPKVSGCRLLPLKLPVLPPPFPSSPLSSSFRVPGASRPSTCREKQVTNYQGTPNRCHLSGHVTEPGVTLILYLRCELDNCWLFERAATRRGSRRGTRALVRGSRVERRRAQEMWSTILELPTLVHYWLHSTSDFMKRRIQCGAKLVWKVFLKGNFLGLWLQCGSGEVCPGRSTKQWVPSLLPRRKSEGNWDDSLCCSRTVTLNQTTRPLFGSNASQCCQSKGFISANYTSCLDDHCLMLCCMYSYK